MLPNFPPRPRAIFRPTTRSMLAAIAVFVAGAAFCAVFWWWLFNAVTS